jgi:hypothetical protein
LFAPLEREDEYAEALRPINPSSVGKSVTGLELPARAVNAPTLPATRSGFTASVFASGSAVLQSRQVPIGIHVFRMAAADATETETHTTAIRAQGPVLSLWITSDTSTPGNAEVLPAPGVISGHRESHFCEEILVSEEQMGFQVMETPWQYSEFLFPGCSIAEKEQQIDPRTLDATKRRARGQRLRVGEGCPEAEKTGQDVFDGHLVVRLLAELPAEPCRQAGSDLVADCHLWAGTPGIVWRVDLDDLEARLLLDSLQEGRGEETCREGTCADQQVRLLVG